MSITLAEAIRNAVEAEHAAAGFYRDLAGATSDAAARAMLLEIAAEEQEHAAGLLLVARQLEAGELPARADAAVRAIESAPAAADAHDLGFEQALSLALEAELSGALYYDGLASSCDGQVAEFFARVAQQEERHAERIRARLSARAPTPPDPRAPTAPRRRTR